VSSRFDEVRDYAFADRALAVRKRSGLTQRDLAALLGVSYQSLSGWENGLSYPSAEHLEALIACLLERGAFATGQEGEEAAALWETARARAAQRLPPFNPAWFASLRRASSSGTLARGPTNMPPARTSFVGRAADLAALARALDPQGDGARLLTLTGVAGCGKTRLALAAAGALRDRYSDGCWLVELALLPASTATDPGPVTSAVLTALGLHELPDHTPLDLVAAHLRTRRLLLVLDNCEHVAAPCATLTAWLLRTCPGLRILATSQRTLGTADETVRPVATFAAPPPVVEAPTPAALEMLGQFDAVRLFVERARAMRPGFALDTENAAGVVAICRRLEGLPLAIELAAARLGVLSLEEVLLRLDDRFRLLRRGGRDAADRHQALQATLDWSYGLLDPAARALLRRLSVFVDGWDLNAAEQVCAGDVVAAEAVLELLDELLDRSLVSIYEAGGLPRYGMLATVRHYGAQHLRYMGETAQVHGRHLAWYVTLAEQAESALLGPEQIAWLARLDREHENLRSALRWALDQGLGASGLRMAAGLWQFWRNRGYLSEGRRWLRALLARAAEAADPPDLMVRAAALEGAAWLAQDQHDFTEATALFAESGALRRVAGLDDRPSGLLINEAMNARAVGDYVRAASLLEAVLAQQRAAGNRESIMAGGLGLSLARLALVLREQGAYARALSLYEECQALHRELGDREGVASALLGLCDIARDQGDQDQMAWLREQSATCLAVFRAYGLHWAIGFSLNNLAQAALQEGDLVQAARHAEECVALFRSLRAGPSLAEVLITLGCVRAAQGDDAAARAHLVEALTLAWGEGPRVFAAAALEALAVLASRQLKAWQEVYLLSTAAWLRQTMGAPARPVDRPAIEAALAAGRAALGDDAYAAAWSIGQRQPVEQIITRISSLGASEDRASLPRLATSPHPRPTRTYQVVNRDYQAVSTDASSVCV
jgi:non-specific serine/threonine protein kinase